jgi:hypothetical protein
VGKNFAVLDIFLWDIYRDPLHKFFFRYQSWYLTPCCGLEVWKPTQAIKSVKDPGNIVDLNPKWARTLPSLIYLSWDIYRDPLHNFVFKYQSWYVTPCCGLEVQKPTQALMSVKGTVNTFDWNRKWARTLPSLIYLSSNIYRDRPPQRKFKYRRWYVTPHCGLEVRKPTQALQSFKGAGKIFDRSPKWTRTLPSLDICSWVIYRVPPKSKYQSSISGQLKAYIGGSKGKQAITHGLLEVTSTEAALTGNDVTWSDLTGRYVITGSMFCVCSEVLSCAFFLPS